MPSPLFREEAVARAHRRLEGSVLIATPLPARLLTGLVVAVVVAAAVFLATASYARKETVQGQVVAIGGLAVELAAPVRAARFMAPGQTVRVKYEAFPDRAFDEGRVVSVSRVAMPGSPPDAPVYGVRATLTGPSVPLQAGMRLTAEVTVEKHSLLGWLFDPIFARRRRP